MADIRDIVAKMRNNSVGIRFDDLVKVCEHYFTFFRQKGSHRKYKTGVRGDPLINLQEDHGKAKRYQVEQVLTAIDKKETHEN